MTKIAENDEQETLKLQDLLGDNEADLLSNYLSVSIEEIASGTKVSITTVDANPTTYTATLTPDNLGDLQHLVDSSGDIFLE